MNPTGNNREHAEASRVTFGDQEAGGVEAGSDGGGGVNHPRLVDPLKGAFLRMPLDCVEWVTVGWRGNQRRVREQATTVELQLTSTNGRSFS